jgi:hypothetical protein
LADEALAVGAASSQSGVPQTPSTPATPHTASELLPSKCIWSDEDTALLLDAWASVYRSGSKLRLRERGLVRTAEQIRSKMQAIKEAYEGITMPPTGAAVTASMRRFQGMWIDSGALEFLSAEARVSPPVTAHAGLGTGTCPAPTHPRARYAYLPAVQTAPHVVCSSFA